MGSVVEYRCASCAFSSGQLTVGWGKAGRGSYWGGLARCDTCRELSVVDLADTRPDRRDHRCAQCKAPLTLLEGLAERVGCPRCGHPMHHTTLSSWA